jgi:hypothetical protein
VLVFSCLLLARPASAELSQWRLVLVPEAGESEVEVLVDPYEVAASEDLAFDHLPAFDFSYRLVGDELTPLQAIPPAGDHPLWQYLLGRGRLVVGEHGDRLELPVTLAEKNANCVHNALLTVPLPGIAEHGSQPAGDDPPAVEVVRLFESEARFSLASETCRYFQWNMAAKLVAQVEVSDAPPGARSSVAERAIASEELPAIAQDFPGIDLAALANSAVVKPDSMTVYGSVLDGVHYRGPCPTRRADYPLCDQLVVPSYSTAKSLFAGLALMRLEKLYPGASGRYIADYVPECDRQRWGDVTFAQALNMVTGNYLSAKHLEDEDNPEFVAAFHLALTHKQKVEFSCSAYPRQTSPGAKWVYHSTDTYLLGIAMTGLLREYRGKDADLFEDILLPLWEPLGLSPMTRYSRRTYDDTAQPFTGFGLYFLPQDLARLAQALGNGYFHEQVDADMLDASLQGGRVPHGYPAEGEFFYSNGFFAMEVGEMLGCETSHWLSFMSGYGGIRVALLGDGDSYYYFSDGNVFDFREPLKAIHEVRPLC